MVAAGAVTKPVLFVGSFVAKPLIFAGQKAFNSNAKFLGLSSAKEAKVAANSGKAEEVLFSVRGDAASSTGSKAFVYTEAEAAKGAVNLAQAEKMSVNLELQQIFTKDGKLTEAGIKAADPIMKVENFNKLSPAYKAMAERGNIEHWHKCTIKLETKFHVPSKRDAFAGEVHVYKNVVTNEIYYDLDYKIKIPKLDIHVAVEDFLDNMSFTWRPKP